MEHFAVDYWELERQDPCSEIIKLPQLATVDI